MKEGGEEEDSHVCSMLRKEHMLVLIRQTPSARG